MPKIPDEFHKGQAFNCLNKEQWQKFREKFQIGDSFLCDCDECGLFVINDDGHHRCFCGNRRCYIYCNERKMLDGTQDIIWECEVW